MAALLQRLDELERRVGQLEQRNRELEQQASAPKQRLESPEAPGSESVQSSRQPTIRDPAEDISFRPRALVQAEAAAYRSRAGGYDFTDGAHLRRAQLGFEGTAFRWWNYRIIASFAGNAAKLLDVSLQYSAIPHTLITVGQHKSPFGLESNNGDNGNVFLERGMFTNAFGNAGAERRIGLSAAYRSSHGLNIAAGVFGDEDALSHPADGVVQSIGVHGRVAWDASVTAHATLHLGLAGYERWSPRSGDVGDAVRLTDHPNLRIDEGNIADSGLIRSVRALRYFGQEVAGVLGPVTIAGEHGQLWVDRGPLGTPSFDGYYVYGSWLLTGEHRTFVHGNYDRLVPLRPFDKGGPGAIELAVRLDRIDLSRTPVAEHAGNRAWSRTIGLNWYLDPYVRIMLNWVRFTGVNSPLDPLGGEAKGDALATRLSLDF